MEYVTGLDQVQRNLEKLAAREMGGIVAAFRELQTILVKYADTNHPWQNETGMTVATTRADIVKADLEEIVLSLSAGMDYDVFLELARDGKWAWLLNALVANEDVILQVFVRNCGLAGLGVAGSLVALVQATGAETIGGMARTPVRHLGPGR